MNLLKTRSFKWWEIALIKVCLISLGILLGLYFYNALIGLIWFWWFFFAVTAVYFIVHFFREG